MRPLAGVVLAGGTGRRLGGRDKALVEVGGSRLVDRVLGELRRAATGEVVVVRGQQPAIVGVEVPQLPDAIPDAGPLSGLVAGLEAVAAGAPAAAVVAVDTPGVSAEVLRRLASHLPRAELP